MLKKNVTILMMMLALLLVACGGAEQAAEESVMEAEETAAEVDESMDSSDDSAEMSEEMDDDSAMAEDADMDDDSHMDDEDGEAHDDMDDDDGEMESDEAMTDDGEMAEASDDAMMEEMGAAGAYTVDSAASTVEWLGAKAIGDSHFGTIDISEGTLNVENGMLTSGSVIIDMTTILPTDGTSGGMLNQLVGHLKSDDFFSVDSHPTAMLAINSTTDNGDGTYAVTGDLTIKGITNPIEFVATAEEAGGVIMASADIVFDRSLYDVQYGSGSFFSNLGDDLINDEIEITVALVANAAQ